jgi:GMP synthase-like glutamine amidotransferase
MKILVFQHISIEHPGIFRDFLAEDGISWDAVELDTGEPIPSLDDYDALWVMGGPMDVWEEAEYPWLKAEKKAIYEAVVGRNMPFLGVCLGHQLLASALGGEVEKMAVPEIGICEVALTWAGEQDPLFAKIDGGSCCLQWHGAEVTKLPVGGKTLAFSPLCRIQAFRVGKWAYGIQYHVEIGPETVREWGTVPAYEQALESVRGKGALAQLEGETQDYLTVFNQDARRLYQNFMALARD